LIAIKLAFKFSLKFTFLNFPCNFQYTRIFHVEPKDKLGQI